ncbi:MAG: toll/interleukin-1 receptor domain-containing protein [Anaerolineae bacterium]|nr:toll/interleukin-1 receptor domain-containing protein [Anaerolineae bacterium]
MSGAANPAGSYPYRVFISYSHKDRALVSEMVAILESIGLQPLWDRDIHPGMPFTDEIKGLIARAHLFIPLITENAQERPWVHQETGYAQAINIPILPITLHGQNLPDDMIAQLQAVIVQPDMADLAQRLHEVDIDRLVLPPPQRPRGVVAVADWPETRAQMMLEHIQWVTALGVSGRVRHRAGSTTFSIPADRDLSDVIWQARDGVFDGQTPRSDYFHDLQRRERAALGIHARASGCDLVMSHPAEYAQQRGSIARRVRLESLLEFFAQMTNDLLRVIFLPQRVEGNIVSVGDYFVAESVAQRPGGWMQTVFNAHPPTVLQRVRQFDQEFAVLYPRYGITLDDAMAEMRHASKALPPIPVT